MEQHVEDEDLELLQVAIERISGNERKSITREYALKELGTTEEELDNVPPVEIEDFRDERLLEHIIHNEDGKRTPHANVMKEHRSA